MSMTDATFEKNTIELLKGIYDNINTDPGYKSIVGVFSIEYGLGYITTSELRSNTLNRFLANYEAGSTVNGYYITLKVLTDTDSNGAPAQFLYSLDSRNIDITLGPGYDINAFEGFTIKKEIEGPNNEILRLTIYSKTLENFGWDSNTSIPIGSVPFEIRFYDLTPLV